MGLEREHKWLIEIFPDTTRLEAAFAAAGAAMRPANVREQHDTYFDTPERQLSAMRAALRVRRFDAETLATYKGPGAVVGSLHTREEIEVPFTPPWPGVIGAKLTSLGVAAARLVPLLDLHTTRTRYLLHRDAAPVAELSFDEVRAVHGGRSVQFRELELEALPDTPDAILEGLGAVLSTFDLTSHEGDKLTHARSLLRL